MNIHTVHLIFTAALVHIHNVFFASAEHTRTTARSHFRISCQVLLEIGQAYKNDLRALEIVTSIKSKLETTERPRPARLPRSLNTTTLFLSSRRIRYAIFAIYHSRKRVLQ